MIPAHYSTRKCRHAGILLTLRMKNVLGSSLGAVGDLSRRRPTSSGRRSALRLFTSLLARTQFSHEVLPPRERGRTWSMLPSLGRSDWPVSLTKPALPDLLLVGPLWGL